MTAAAVLLAVAIGAFASSRVVFLKEIGIGAVAAVLIDAFIVRTLLVPALMGLLGRWNWWSPPALRRLHRRIGIGEGERASQPGHAPRAPRRAPTPRNAASRRGGARAAAAHSRRRQGGSRRFLPAW